MDGTARLMNYGYASMGYRGDGVEMADPTAPRTWFYFNEFGKMKTVQMDKYSVATRLQIPLRDMRVLDREWLARLLPFSPSLPPFLSLPDQTSSREAFFCVCASLTERPFTVSLARSR